ncbi:T9SS type A sorting domain-containing protein [Chryseobacterium tructae]|uniref:T9SS type A sorting domain-containing protein n=2 Tax=Chryseobacterium tructae TaxID=1037380 RepID=A0ABV7XVH9_9FLAO
MKCKLLKLFLFAIVLLQASLINAQTDEVRIQKIEVNGNTYTNSSTITLNKGQINTYIKVTYSISKYTPNYLNTGLNVKFFAKMVAGSPYQIFIDSPLFPTISGTAQTYEYTAIIPNTSALIESNNSGKLFMVYTYGNTNATSNTFPVNFVQPAISNNKISGSVITDYQKPAPTITGSEPTIPFGNYTYYWQRKNPGGNWYNLNYGTINTKDYTPPASENRYNYKLRRAVEPTKPGLETSYSNEVDVRINIEENNIVESVTNNGANVIRTLVGSTPRGGTNSFTYQWQEQTNDSFNWYDISGAVNINYEVPSISSAKFYRRIARSSAVPQNYSNGIKIDELKILGNLVVTESYNNIIESEKVQTGQIPKFSRLTTHPTANLKSATGYPMNIQWQSKTEGGTWNNISGATNADYTINTPLTQTTQYKRYIQSQYLPDSESNIITVVVSEQPPIENNKISFDPLNTDHLLGTTPTGGTGDYTYVWAVDLHPDDSIGEFIFWSVSSSPNTNMSEYENAIPLSSNEYHYTRYAISGGVWQKSNTLIFSPEDGIIQGKKISKASLSNKEDNKKMVVAATNNNDIYFNFKNYSGTKADIYLVNVSGGQPIKIMQTDLKDNNSTQISAFPTQYLPGIYIYKIVFNDGSVQTGKIIKK